MSSEAKMGTHLVLDGQPLEQQNVIDRVANLPLVSSTCHLVVSAYTSTKETSPYLKSVCNVAEKGVKTLTAAALFGAQPLVTRLEPQLATASVYACRGLDKLEEKLPILQQPSDKVVADTKELLSNKVTGARDAVSSSVNGAKEAVSSGVSGMVDVAKGAVQGSMEMTCSVVAGGVNSVMGSRVGEMITAGVDTMLGKSEELVDYYLPMTDRELAELATSLEGFEIGTVQQQKEPKSYFVRLGSLSGKLRQRVFPHFLAKLKDAKESTQDALGQLHHTLVLIQHVRHGVDQTLENGQEKLHQMWLVWSQRHPRNCRPLDSSAQTEVESRAMAMFRGLTRQLQLSYLTFVSQLRGLPTGLQDKAKLIWHMMEDLNGSFLAAGSFQEVSPSTLAQSCQRIVKARGSVDEIVDYVVQNVPLPWVVGPFAPSLVELPYTSSMEGNEEGEDPPRRRLSAKKEQKENS
ncbi:perilipin-3-like isoform X1 [Notechis scutatus]|uniref:Perilipin n=1 Tax=Notechis scutatus TaxID=8663 RepID=A0A6J1VZD3_9SAUR|nr:perilipin-3-like isoform X1 [Notechis scutatus]